MTTRPSDSQQPVPVDLYFWEPIVSPHKTPFFEALAKHPGVGRVTVVADTDLPSILAQQGWQSAQDDLITTVVGPSHSTIKEIVATSSFSSIHVFSGIRWRPVLRLGLRAVHKSGRKYGILSEPRASEGVSGFLRYIHSWLTESRFRRGASFVLAIGRHGPRWFKSVGYSQNVFPFAYFLDPTPLSAGPPFDVIYLGRLEPEKGFDVFCAAADRLSDDVTIHVVGSGTLAHLAEQRAKARHSWTFHGTVPMSAVSEILSRATVLCAPSVTTNDGWCMAISEALVSGCSVVTTPKTGASICLENNPALGQLVPVNDPSSTAQALRKLLSDGERLPALRKQRRKWAKRALTSTVGAAYFMEIMSNVFAGAAKPAAPWITEGPSQSSKSSMRKVAIAWDNFGPLHYDRIEAVASAVPNPVVGLQLCGNSDTYGWASNKVPSFEMLTLFQNKSFVDIGNTDLFFRLVKTTLRKGISDLFISHYDRPGVFFASAFLSIFGVRCFTMGCSKFDDKPRFALREILKSMFLIPYRGALSGSIRTVDYLSFLGINRNNQRLGYNSVSNARIRSLAKSAQDVQFSDKNFIIISRLVPKKNIEFAIRCYAEYLTASADTKRNLVILGNGPLQERLMELANSLGVGSRVIFAGFIQSGELEVVMSGSVALLLLSKEEQFGNVIPEALALGIPTIVSAVCGARDMLVRSHVNGFVVEPDNIASVVAAMMAVTKSEADWNNFSEKALEFSQLSDSSVFGRSVSELISPASA